MNTISGPWGYLCTFCKYILSFHSVYEYNIWSLSSKFKRVSLSKTPELPFWGPNICVGFDLRDSKKRENINELKKIIFHYKNIDIHKTA